MNRESSRSVLAAGLIVTVQLAMGQRPLAQQATPPVAPTADASNEAFRGGGRGAVDSRVHSGLIRLPTPMSRCPMPCLFRQGQQGPEESADRLLVRPRRRSEHHGGGKPGLGRTGRTGRRYPRHPDGL